MPYFRCSECDSLFHSDEASRYIWCSACGQPLDVQHQVPEMIAPESVGPDAAEAGDQPRLSADRQPDPDPAEELAPGELEDHGILAGDGPPARERRFGRP